MDRTIQYRNMILLSLLLFILPSLVASQDIIRVNSEQAHIFVEPNLENKAFMMAQKGDVFKVDTFNKDWVGIKMFSGYTRYLKLDDVTIESNFSANYSDFPERLQLCDEVQEISDQSSQEADSEYPEDKKQAESYESRLIDKRVLRLLREQNIAAVHHTIFLDCVNDYLVPGSDL